MKALHLYILLLFAVLVSFCTKRKYPESNVVNSTVYGFTGTINNRAIAITAGVNNYYMYSSYQQDSNSVYNLIGTLKEMNCSDCRNSLKIQINDFKVTGANAPMVLDSILVTKSYPFLSGNENYLAQFQSQYNRTAASYAWDFGDGSTSSDANPSHLYAKSGNYPVQLKIVSTQGYENTIRQIKTINVAPFNFSTDITATSASGNSITFQQTTTGGTPPYTYLWNFGDGQSSTLDNPTHVYAVGGSRQVTLRVTDANHQSITAAYNAVTQTDNSSCAANFKLVSVTPQANVIRELSKIIISWTDDQGITYTSNNELQPADSHFQITSIEDGGTNENNLLIKKLHITFNCKVYNGTTILTVNNAEAIIAVAYK